eukprot:jgi/Ulvmu1/1144/UM107_0018.1
MAGCYCGLGTRANRWKWTTFGVLLVLGFVFLFAAFGQTAKCSRSQEIERCEERARFVGNPDGAVIDPCQKLEDEEQACVNDNYILLSGLILFWIMSWFGASIPLYMMCCCTDRPRREEPLPEGMQLGIPQTFSAPQPVPAGYPVLPVAQQPPPRGGFLATPSAPIGRQEDEDVGIPMYTATIK